MKKKRIVKICLTGGIGTGKTFLSKHFEDMGIPVYHSDDKAKKLYAYPEFIEQLRSAPFVKKELINPNGTVNTDWLRGQFGDRRFFTEFSKFVHEWVHDDFKMWAACQGKPAVIMESAIVFEYHNESLFDKIIVADAPLWLRIKRIKERNPNLTESEIMERINSQMPQEEKCRRADLVICTGETYAIGNLWNKEKL
jgi:dephospho-CoA kinase